MADQKTYKLRAIGPATKRAAVDDDSVNIQSLEDGAKPIMSGRLTPQDFLQFAVANRTQWSQNTVGSEVGVTEIAAFGFHYAPYDDTTGFLAATGLSYVGAVALIPISVSAKISAGKGFEEAVTKYEAVFMDAAPVEGTTAGTPPDETTRYSLGASTLNGTAVDRLISQELKFGLEVEFDIGKSGAIIPTSWIVKSFEPVITYETENLGLVLPYVKTPATVAGDTVIKFQDQAGSAGKSFTMSKARVSGEISGSTGTLTVKGLLDTNVLVAGSY